MTKKGTIKNSIEGKEGYNNFGSKIIVKKYRKYSDIDVYFPEYDWTFEHSTMKEFKNGKIKCPYEPRIYGVGYTGEGKYKISENSKLTKCYRSWFNMMQRCYSEKYQEKCPTYKGCKVCDEWLNFQNFAKWFDENYYEIPGEKMCLDKDILMHGNKIYSPETCIFVPQRINSLFTKSDKLRGEYPIGVRCREDTNKLQVQCSIYKNGKHSVKKLGTYPLDQVNEAFLCYKQFKENNIKQVADEYKDLIPEKLYIAMYNWEVKITD